MSSRSSLTRLNDAEGWRVRYDVLTASEVDGLACLGNPPRYGIGEIAVLAIPGEGSRNWPSHCPPCLAALWHAVLNSYPTASLSPLRWRGGGEGFPYYEQRFVLKVSTIPPQTNVP